MELFLNLCWLALLLPAYTLWRQRASSNRSARTSSLFICTLVCVLVLLFPVISASDDLHAVGQVMEESKRTLRHGGFCNCSTHSINSSELALVAQAAPKVAFEKVGNVASFASQSFAPVFASAPTGRAPPAQPSISL
ncbi:MAG: hypothetical protein ABSD39_16035 [Terriglobales bacterium]|jgi:hypothetical protein